jgi:DNA-binding NtrC family response regulator
MAVRVVVVHDEPDVGMEVAVALKVAGYEVDMFPDPMIALDALESSVDISVLITDLEFSPGKPNGISLARMARIRRPGLQVVIVGRPEFAAHADGLGAFVPAPIDIADVVAIVGRRLNADGERAR